MGQKVHPLGFRIGITKKHQSQWFARFHKHGYSQSVLEDKMLRNTLMKLFPDLLKKIHVNSPAGQNSEKRSLKEDKTNIPKITQIKIERGLIPYELGIQIHAENCELIKSAIDKLKIDRDLACYLQKAKKFLVYLGQKPKLKQPSKVPTKMVAESNLNKEILGTSSTQENVIKTLNQRKAARTSIANKTLKRLKKIKNKISPLANGDFAKINLRSNKKPYNSFGKKRGPKLTKQQFRRKKLIQRRLRKRLNIRLRYQKFMAKGLFIRKNNKHKNGVPLTPNQGPQIIVLLGKPQKKFGRKQLNKFKTASPYNNNNMPSRQKSIKLQEKNRLSSTAVLIRIKRKIQKKFITIYLNKMNKNFLIHLKRKVQLWGTISPTKHYNVSGGPEGQLPILFPVNKPLILKTGQNFIEQKITVAPFGYSKDWAGSLKKFKSLTAPFKLNKLIQLAKILEKKSFSFLKTLRKYFITFGVLSNTQAYSYYQLINFLKHLTQLIRKRVTNLRLGVNKIKSKQILYKTLVAKTNNILLRANTLKLAKNVDDECRKIKFIEYLKQIVKKHRTENLFYYLSTLSKAKKDLKQIKRFTLKNAQYLFGKDNTQISLDHQHNKMIVKEALSTLQNSKKGGFIQQIEKQKFISKENLKLTPKISIKFYSVNPKSLELKASVVADSIIDALEQRKAFRGVIKKTKEELMKKPSVKGIKIQVAGRLNGAEIARTEWVRAGRVPLQTLRANIDYCYNTANTIYGIIGVKVWIFKGYTKTL
nr:ribosomal protein S3 [Palmellopsis texensis]